MIRHCGPPRPRPSIRVSSVAFHPTPAASIDRRELLVVSPHAKNLDGFGVIQDLVDEPVLDVDTARACAGKIAQEFLVAGRCLVWIASKDVEELLGLRLEPRASQLLRVSPGLCGIDERPVHQSSSVAHLPTGVFSPFRIESRIPGMVAR